MGKCIKCGNYCNDSYNFCYDCYQNIITYCDICNTAILHDDQYTKYFDIDLGDYIYICNKCKKDANINNQPRDKYKKDIRTDDGHLVASKNELIIDNYLFQNRIAHIYEKIVIDKTNPDNECTCDFYLPDLEIYIEVWGMSNDEYLKKRQYKENIYKNNNYKKIDIEQENIEKGINYYLEKQLLILTKTKRD